MNLAYLWLHAQGDVHVQSSRMVAMKHLSQDVHRCISQTALITPVIHPAGKAWLCTCMRQPERP